MLKNQVESSFVAVLLNIKNPQKRFWESEFRFWERIWGCFWEVFMQKKNYKGRCTKRTLSKCKGVCRTYTQLQNAYADIIQNHKEVVEFETNVSLDGLEYTSDFLFKKVNGDLGVRECVNRNHLTKPMVVKLLDMSRAYWLSRGVDDWGVVIERE